MFFFVPISKKHSNQAVAHEFQNHLNRFCKDQLNKLKKSFAGRLHSLHTCEAPKVFCQSFQITHSSIAQQAVFTSVLYKKAALHFSSAPRPRFHTGIVQTGVL